MKILFLTCHLPFPPLSGGRRREYELIKRLSNDFEIYLCCITKTYESDFQNLNYAKKYCQAVFLFQADDLIKFDAMPQKILTLCYPQQVLRHMSAAARMKITQLLEQDFDLIHVEGYYLMQNLPFNVKPPIILVDQNIEYLLYEQQLNIADGVNKQRCSQEYMRTHTWERHAWRQSGMCVLVTHEDYRHVADYLNDGAVRYVPDGFDHSTSLWNMKAELRQQEPSVDPTILYVGNFGYHPNVDAALYFVHEIFPQVLARLPNARLLLVGNAPPQSILDLARPNQITVTGLVPSLAPFFEQADLFICPLRIGGGIKVKILEALYAGMAIVTTSIGAQGLGFAFKQAACVCDDPQEFAEQVIKVINNPELRRHLQNQALESVKTMPTWNEATNRLAKCYQDLASGRTSEAAASETGKWQQTFSMEH